MNNVPYHPGLHRFAVLTAGVALLPIVVGAVVTSLDAGMAFADWPSSDGHNMLLYPWLKSAGDQFVEHGHRLAGMLIGIFSIMLCVAVWKCESRGWVRGLAVMILLGVISQGLLGGLRVLNADPRLALLHGTFAACVFALMSALALFTSRSWLSAQPESADRAVSPLKPLAVLLLLAVFTQYVLGGLLRHLGLGLYEHLGFALLVFVFSVMTAIVTRRSRIAWLLRPAWLLLCLVLLQAALGAGAWVTKFGLASAGFVAVQYSTSQIVLHTAHTVVGMFVFMMSTIYVLRVFHLDWLYAAKRRVPSDTPRITATVSLSGGAG